MPNPRPAAAASRALPLLLGLALSCGGSDGRLEPRYVAVHNTLTALGLAQTGAISEGSLGEEGDARVVVPMAAGECVVFVAFGSGGIADLDLTVVDANGDTLASDGTSDRQAAVQVCAPRAGDYAVVLRVAEGHGEYTLGTWGGASGAGPAGAVAAAGGTCARPLPVTFGVPVTGTTAGAEAGQQASCVRGAAPEQVYVLEVGERAQVTAVLDSEYDGALYLRRGCTDASSEVTCNDDSPDDDTTRSEIRATLDPGTYFLFVDGYGEEAGAYQLLVTQAELPSIEEVCRAARPIAPGQAVSGDTSGRPDHFQATCAGGARSPDVVHRLEVRQRSRLRVRQRTDHDGALYVQSRCGEVTSEVACNDDFADDQRRSLVRAVVEPGDYYVVTDGYAAAAAGPYSFTAELEDAAGSGAPGDACDAPTALAAPPDAALEVDTFAARDDLAGSCGGGGGADVVYAFDVPRRSLVRATVEESEAVPVLYLRGADCADAAGEVACQAGVRLDTVVPRGRYHLVVDGASPLDFGAARVTLDVTDAAPLERACRRAPALRPGRTVRGDTTGSPRRFEATCAGGAASPDDIYRLSVRRPSRVVLDVASEYDAALHLRGDCLDPSSELACNDDHEDNRHSRIERDLEPGTYYVIVDGFRDEAAGTYTLDVTVTPR